jgi:hypothetical protein
MSIQPFVWANAVNARRKQQKLQVSLFIAIVLKEVNATWITSQFISKVKSFFYLLKKENCCYFKSKNADAATCYNEPHCQTMKGPL